MKNCDVACAWARGRRGQSGHLFTDGVSIWSYGLLIGEWKDSYGEVLREGLIVLHRERVVYDYTAPGGAFESMTTSRHVSEVKRYADRVVSVADKFLYKEGGGK